MAGQLTLDGADVGDVAALVDGDLGAGPVDVEVSLDNHVGSGGSEETLVDGSLQAERVGGGAAESREDSGRDRHGGARGVMEAVSCKQLASSLGAVKLQRAPAGSSCSSSVHLAIRAGKPRPGHGCGASRASRAKPDTPLTFRRDLIWMLEQLLYNRQTAVGARGGNEGC